VPRAIRRRTIRIFEKEKRSHKERITPSGQTQREAKGRREQNNGDMSWAFCVQSDKRRKKSWFQYCSNFIKERKNATTSQSAKAQKFGGSPKTRLKRGGRKGGVHLCCLEEKNRDMQHLAFLAVLRTRGTKRAEGKKIFQKFRPKRWGERWKNINVTFRLGENKEKKADLCPHAEQQRVTSNKVPSCRQN